MALQLIDGSEAIAEAALSAGLRFYAGYPMSPATDLLEQLAKKLPGQGGVCINADTEIEGVNQAIGAAMTGFRAATGSTGQGLSLMQEAIAEIALNETPLVIFNMGRNQQDYFQATRGGGWGDYRTIALCPKDGPEAVELTQLAFHLADQYRAPVILYGDNMLARTISAVDTGPIDFGPLPPKDWAFDGSSGGTGRSKQIWTWALGKHNTPGPGPEGQWRMVAEKFERMRLAEQRWEQGYTEDAEVVVTAFGTGGKFVEYVVDELRREGHKVGWFRPITLWPFPEDALEAACASARLALVFELNAGQMVEDVRLSLGKRIPIRSIGGISFDDSGLNIGSYMDAGFIKRRILEAMEAVPS
jgi:2-oxoglutarate/2-oxoacid ferredoxin oxidoreductase subunit alpha